MSMVERCVGCHAQVEVIDGPIHRYMTSAPACWKRYGELLAILYGQSASQVTRIMCVDTYAAQHPGTPNPQAIQSVAIHLLNMYNYLVRGQPVKIPQATFSKRAFHSIAPPEQRALYWLEPPSFECTRTVFDLPIGEADDALTTGARTWAESVWAAWSAHHAQIASWYSRFASW